MQTDATTPNIAELTMLGELLRPFVGSNVLSANEKEENFATNDKGYYHHHHHHHHYYYYYYNYYYIKSCSGFHRCQRDII